MPRPKTNYVHEIVKPGWLTHAFVKRLLRRLVADSIKAWSEAPDKDAIYDPKGTVKRIARELIP